MPPLPGLTKNGRRVVVMRAMDLEHIAANVADGMKTVLMIGDIRLKEEQIGVAGDVYILDASAATPQNFAQHFAKFTPSLLKKFFICVQVRKSILVSEIINRRENLFFIFHFAGSLPRQSERSSHHQHFTSG